jgi:hypothetical protein
MRFQHPAVPGGSITATVIIGLKTPGTLPPGDLSLKPRLGPWARGVPPMPLQDWPNACAPRQPATFAGHEVGSKAPGPSRPP